MEKKILNLLLVLLTFPIAIFAKITLSDTTFFYVSKDHKLCAPDTAFFIIKKFKLNDKLWSKVEMELKSLDTNYELRSFDSSFNKLEDTSTHFTSHDRIQDIYQKGKIQKVNFYSRSGRLEGYEILASNGKDAKEQKGWDAFGNEIPNYICQREASFNKKDFGDWVQYLAANLNKDVPLKYGAPRGHEYVVIVQFSVDKKGNVVGVLALNNPGFGTAEEAVRVVNGSPNWLPAIQNNRPVIYRQRQQITFQVP
jgi:periplasmic protein TonB